MTDLGRWPGRARSKTAFRITAFALAGTIIGTSSLSWAAEDGGNSSGGVPVVVARATNACFSDMVRGIGFVVPRREAYVSPDSEGSIVTDVLVHAGDLVTANQELARLTPPPGGNRAAAISLRAPAAGLVTDVHTAVGAPASPQAGPMFKIAVNNEVELNAEIPGLHILKLAPGATARIHSDEGPDLAGQVRLVSPVIDRTTQMGHVRLSLSGHPTIKIGTFARVAIDAKRSCGVAIPRSSIDHLTVQVVKGNTVETRQVRVGLTSDTAIEILEGLKIGDVVVADAGTSLHDGDQVKPMFADELDRSRGR